MKAKQNPSNYWQGKPQTYENNNAEMTQFMNSKSVDRLDISGVGTPIQLIPNITTRG